MTVGHLVLMHSTNLDLLVNWIRDHVQSNRLTTVDDYRAAGRGYAGCGFRLHMLGKNGCGSGPGYLRAVSTG
jgi:hypothetical protein